MSSEIEDLTTDAVPDPPRDENKPTEPTNIEEDLPKNPQFNFRVPRRNNAKKGGGTPAGFAANVININGSTGIQIGSNYTIINGSDEKTYNQNKGRIVETDAIRSLFADQSGLRRDHLMFASIHMDEGWRNVARILNYSDGQIYQFNVSHRDSGIREVIFQFLLDWTQNEPDSATVGKLTTLLWRTDQKDVVQRWANHKEFANLGP